MKTYEELDFYITAPEEKLREAGLIQHETYPRLWIIPKDWEVPSDYYVMTETFEPVPWGEVPEGTQAGILK